MTPVASQQLLFGRQLVNLEPRAERGLSLCPLEGAGRTGAGRGGVGVDPNQEARDHWVREEQQAHAAQSAEEERRDRRVDVSIFISRHPPQNHLAVFPLGCARAWEAVGSKLILGQCTYAR